MLGHDTRSEILQAAGPIFARKGFERATVREICQEANANVAAVNYYFGDKERLYVESVQQASLRRAAQFPLPPWSATTAPRDKLRGFVRTLLNRMLGQASEQWEVQLMVREILAPSDACRALVQEYFRPHFDLLLSILDPFLPASTSDAARRRIGYSVIGQCFYYRVAGEVIAMIAEGDRPSSDAEVEALADHITDFTLAALGHVPRKSENVQRTPQP